MSQPDISKIVGLIMENPSLIEEIRALAGEENESKEEAKTESAAFVPPPEKSGSASKRRELLGALKPYLSEERSRAVDKMLSFTDILEMMRSK